MDIRARALHPRPSRKLSTTRQTTVPAHPGQESGNRSRQGKWLDFCRRVMELTGSE